MSVATATGQPLASRARAAGSGSRHAFNRVFAVGLMPWSTAMQGGTPIGDAQTIESALSARVR